MTAERERAVEAAIASVDDPCSIAARAPLNVFELGLIRSWSVDQDGFARVAVSPTAPSCVLIGSIVGGIEERVAAVEGVTGVDVRVEISTPWSPALMSEAGRLKLEHRREASLAEVPVRPRQWEHGAR